MKVLSLLQPWASMLVTLNPYKVYGGKYVGIKEWETRCWRPKDPELVKRLQQEGLLIHASASTKHVKLMHDWPFSEYKSYMPETLPTGAIIGHVKVNEIWTTEQWLQNTAGETERGQEEYRFGDYSEGRFAWHCVEPTLFKVPIPAKGNLGLWEFDLTAYEVSLHRPLNVKSVKNEY